jgi:hypothetical protein
MVVMLLLSATPGRTEDQRFRFSPFDTRDWMATTTGNFVMNGDFTSVVPEISYLGLSRFTALGFSLAYSRITAPEADIRGNVLFGKLFLGIPFMNISLKNNNRLTCELLASVSMNNSESDLPVSSPFIDASRMMMRNSDLIQTVDIYREDKGLAMSAFGVRPGFVLNKEKFLMKIGALYQLLYWTPELAYLVGLQAEFRCQLSQTVLACVRNSFLLEFPVPWHGQYVKDGYYFDQAQDWRYYIVFDNLVLKMTCQLSRRVVFGSEFGLTLYQTVNDKDRLTRSFGAGVQCGIFTTFILRKGG